MRSLLDAVNAYEVVLRYAATAGRVETASTPCASMNVASNTLPGRNSITTDWPAYCQHTAFSVRLTVRLPPKRATSGAAMSESQAAADA